MSRFPYLVFAVPIVFALVCSIIARLLRPYPAIKNFLASSIAILIILAFAVPFTAAGVWAVRQGMRTHSFQLYLFAVPFLTVGLAFFAALILGGPSIFRQGKIEASHPDQPWMWNSDWARGVVPSHAAGGAVGIWIIALIWNGISYSCAIPAMGEFFRTHESKLLISLIFPAVGLGFLVAAIRAALQAMYFGNSVFHLQNVPAPLGGALAGTIHINRPLAVTGPIQLRLTCHQIYHQNNNTNSNSDSVIWEDEQRLDSLPESADGTDIPVYFVIPADQRATVSHGNSQVSWQIEATAPTSSLTYRSKFSVPVFAVKDVQPIAQPDFAAPYRHHESLQQPERIPGITVSLLSDKGRVIHVAAARNPGAAAMTTAFGIIFTAVAALLPQSSAPIIFPIAFGLAALFIDMAAINSWLSSSTITARPHSLTVVVGLPLMQHHYSLNSDTISEINEQMSSQSNSAVFYALYATADGKKTKLASGIRGKENAQRLIKLINQGLGRAQVTLPTT